MTLLASVAVFAVLSGFLGGILGGYLAVREFGRQQTRTPLSPSGYFCEVCSAPALNTRTHDGRRVCAAHKGG